MADIQGIAREVKNGNNDRLELLFDYFLSSKRSRVYKYYDTTGVLDKDDFESIAKSEIWKSCLEFDIDLGFTGQVLIRIRNGICNELWKTHPSSKRNSKYIPLEDKFLNMFAGLTEVMDEDDAKYYYRYLVSEVYSNLSKQSPKAARLFQIRLLGFKRLRYKTLKIMLGNITIGRVSQLNKLVRQETERIFRFA